MNKKHLKIYKGIALVAGGITVANMISSSLFIYGFKVKPFTHNELKAYEVTSKEYTKNGINEYCYYSCELESNHLIIKQPYTPEIGYYSRLVYNIPTKKYSREEIDFIIENIDNVDLLLEQEYIQYTLEHLHFNNGVAYDTVSIIPDDNNYEFEYIEFNRDGKYKIISSEEIDSSINMYYLLITGMISITEFIMYITLKNAARENNNIKTLEKKINQKKQ